ncbi:MAG: hypothetical protein JWQ03_2242 [Variovorax sp.]|nr:hypothetical protein [Variovorax sp.]
MKILLVGNSLRDGQVSMLAFARVLQKELTARGIEVRLVHPPAILGKFAKRDFTSKWLGYLDKFALYPARLRREAAWANIVHVCDHSNAMYVRRALGSAILVTCHDVIAIQAALGMIPGWKVSKTGYLFQWLIRRGLGRADQICCSSERTREDLLTLGIAPSERVSTLWNGLNDDFSPVEPDVAAAALAPLGVTPGTPYLLHVGTDLARKNRFTVLRAFAALAADARAQQQWPGLQLVFVGPPLNNEMQAFATSAGLQNRILVLKDLDSHQLRSIYSAALAFLFPSTSEGFGWPLIEAQACGCPVITSDLSPMNQIGGDAALYVQPFDHDAIARCLLDNVDRWPEFSRKSITNAARFSTSDMVNKYIAAYEALLKQSK